MVGRRSRFLTHVPFVNPRIAKTERSRHRSLSTETSFPRPSVPWQKKRRQSTCWCSVEPPQTWELWWTGPKTREHWSPTPATKSVNTTVHRTHFSNANIVSLVAQGGDRLQHALFSVSPSRKVIFIVTGQFPCAVIVARLSAFSSSQHAPSLHCPSHSVEPCDARLGGQSGSTGRRAEKVHSQRERRCQPKLVRARSAQAHCELCKNLLPSALLSRSRLSDTDSTASSFSA